jgi:hypothetical protein
MEYRKLSGYFCEIPIINSTTYTVSSTFPAGGSKPPRFPQGKAGAGRARTVTASLGVAADAQQLAGCPPPPPPPEAASVAAAPRRPGPVPEPYCLALRGRVAPIDGSEPMQNNQAYFFIDIF